MDRQTSKKVAQTAIRLRALQSDLADESDVTRQKHLLEAIEQSLGEVDDRESFLKYLLEAFPAWEGHKVSHGGTDSGATRSEHDQHDLEDPAFLVQRLIGLAASMSPDQKRALGEQLSQAGLIDHSAEMWSQEAVERLRSAMKLGEGQSVNADRLLELAQALIGFAVNLEQVSWTTWRAAAPRSSVRRGAAIDITIRRYLSGDSEVTRSQVGQDLEQLRRLTASLILALGRASEHFSNGFLARFAPEQIEALVQKPLLPVFQEMAYWRKYKQLTADLNDAAIEQEIKQAIAQFVESLMIGTD